MSVSKKSLTVPDARQEQLLREAKLVVQNHAFHMKRALDSTNIMEALKHASTMISELRTGLLMPRAYYALYILVFDELRYLEIYISEGGHGKSLQELYELVQYAGNILPRLYMLITVGSVYIKKMQVPAKEVLYDIVELCHGIQHPTRGLFLRTYLLEMTKDKLPDEGSKYEGDVTDSIDFIIANFVEMNKLWVRMQHGLHDMDKREGEREELHILVGKNLSRLSQLEGLTIGLYKSDVLPRVLSQIVTCKDKIAQQYLMDILIQAFSDEFHLRTLDQLLDTFHKLQDTVGVHINIISLIKRLANYCVSHPGSMPTDMDMLQVFHTHIDELAKNRRSMSLEAILDLAKALINLAMRCYKERPEYIDTVYDFAYVHIESRGLTEDPQSLDTAMKLLQSPAEQAQSIKPILHLKSYNKVLRLLPWKEKRAISSYLMENLIKNETQLSSPEEVAVLLEYMTPFIKRDEHVVQEDDWKEEQMQVSHVINMFYHKDMDIMVNMLQTAKNFFSPGGEKNTSEGQHISPMYTMVPLTFKSLGLVQTIAKKNTADSIWEQKAKWLLKYANNAISVVKTADVMTAFNLYLQCTLQAAQCGLSEFANGFLTQGAFVLFEDEQITQTKQEYNAIRQLLAVLQSITCFDAETYSTLSKQLAQYASKIVILDYQSRATLLSTYLFATKNPKYKDVTSAVSCLKKSLSTMSSVVEADVVCTLYVEALDHFIYFFEMHPDVVDFKHVNGIIQKILKLLSTNQIDKMHPGLVHYRNIFSYVERKKNWENSVRMEKRKVKEVGKDGTEVEGEEKVLNEGDAKAEAERWKEISFDSN